MFIRLFTTDSTFSKGFSYTHMDVWSIHILYNLPFSFQIYIIRTPCKHPKVRDTSMFRNARIIQRSLILTNIGTFTRYLYKTAIKIPDNLPTNYKHGKLIFRICKILTFYIVKFTHDLITSSSYLLNLYNFKGFFPETPLQQMF